MQKKIQKFIFDFEIIAFELVALNMGFYWERILVIGCQYVNSLKISDTTKTQFFELIFFQSNQKIWKNYCRADLCSVSNPLTCWLSISVLIRRFSGI